MYPYLLKLLPHIILLGVFSFISVSAGAVAWGAVGALAGLFYSSHFSKEVREFIKLLEQEPSKPTRVNKNTLVQQIGNTRVLSTEEYVRIYAEDGTERFLNVDPEYVYYILKRKLA